jgi:hypothetical protein
MRLPYLVSAFVFLLYLKVQAQNDSLSASKKDTVTSPFTNQDAIYSRPFIYLGKSTTAVGGYLEGNTNYFVTNGIPQGFSMEMRRFNIFLYSTIAKRVKFLSELEFEHGAREISLETALLDFTVNPAFNFRMGVLLAPIGGFNLNHDSPRWEFINRPLVSTTIIPATLSEVGFGLHGKLFPKNFVITYDLYLVNGLGDNVILNSDGRTSLAQGKREGMFEADNNATPSMTGKLGFRHRRFGEAGFSYYGGIYNTFKLDGIYIDNKRRINLYAFDFNTRIKKLYIVGEFAYNSVQVPNTITHIYGNRQWGMFTDFVYPVLKRTILKWEKAVLNLNLRLEKVDYNIGTFAETGQKKHDEITAMAGGISFRPTATTVIRANYRYHWIKDIIGNPTIRQSGVQVGFASYF